ncbi:MAG: hypothetical protein VKI83_12020, partial [Synechococcaceae cyanobacterium]|nr:hypothetical protein [Synechococcaceae cyanobacterium]
MALLGGGQLADLALRRLYEHWRPQLERQIGAVMGRPLQLGPYRGFGPDGLRVGPSRLLPGSLDHSSASVRGLTVQIDPFGSWQRGEAVLDLSLAGARADLRPDRQGRLWVLGSLAPGQTPPRLDLRLRLLDSADLTIRPLPAGTTPLRLQLQGQVRVQPPQRRLQGLVRVRQPGRSGSLLLEGQGQWQRQFWQLSLRPEGVGLEGLRPWLPAVLGSPANGLSGRASGRVLLRFERGSTSCGGELRIAALRWHAGRGATPLVADDLRLRCRQRQLTASAPLWRFGAWRGSLSAGFDLSRRLALDLQLRPPASAGLGAAPAALRLTGRLEGRVLQISRLRLERRGSWLEGKGRLASRPDLVGRWALAAEDLARIPRLPAALARPGLQGSLALSGSLTDPQLSIRTGQRVAATPLGPWQASLLWHHGRLQLQAFESSQLQASGSLPLRRGARAPLQVGELEARLRLRPLALQRLQPWTRQRLGGVLAAAGTLQGPLRALRLDLALRLVHPSLGPLSLQEVWSGRLRGGLAQGGRLRLASATGLPGSLEASFDRRWRPTAVQLHRGDGSLLLSGTSRQARWQARSLPLAGLALTGGGAARPHPLEGVLDGSGRLAVAPFRLAGRGRISEPRFLAVVARRLDATFELSDRRYGLKASLEPLASGQLDLEAQGRWNGELRAALTARQLTDLSLRQLRRAVAIWRGGSPRPQGQAADLGSLAIRGLDSSLDDQLRLLQASLSSLSSRWSTRSPATAAARLAALRSRFDASVQLRGASLAAARVALQARGHLWLDRRDRDQALLSDPLRFRLEGPLGSGP